jgi:O-antigen/teichoic acid export membrane protein
MNFKYILIGGNERTSNVKKNIWASLILKGINILASLLIIPLTIHYVNPTQYGIWLTLSAIIVWITYFDLGLSQGFRNRFSEAIANNNIELAKQYVSTTYALMFIIFLVAGIVCSFYQWFLGLEFDIKCTCFFIGRTENVYFRY